REGRALARRGGRRGGGMGRRRATVWVERAVLRLAGVVGAGAGGIRWVNRLVDAVAADVGLQHGVAVPAFHAMAAEGVHDLTLLAQKAAAGAVRFDLPSGRELTAARRSARRAAAAGIRRIDRRRTARRRL